MSMATAELHRAATGENLWPVVSLGRRQAAVVAARLAAIPAAMVAMVAIVCQTGF